MVRLTRAQQQMRTRAAVLRAAGAEFAEHGYAEARIDRIADRAELTRGAVYSNFPSKRALYLAVLLAATPGPTNPDPTGPDPTGPDPTGADPTGAGSEPATGPAGTAVPAGHAGAGEAVEPPAGRAAGAGPVSSAGRSAPAAGAGPVGPAAAAEKFARVWLERLPLAGESSAAGRLKSRSLTGVFDDEPGRAARAGLTKLESLLLALGLESCSAGRRVRLAELILTLLTGAAQLAETAPGAGDPFDVVRACRHLAALDLDDVWDPPHLPYVSPPRLCRDPWNPPAGLTDVLTGGRVDLGGDGLVVVLGTSRLGAAEEAIRAARPGDPVTVVVVSADPAETGALVRLRVTDLVGCLRRVFGAVARPPVGPVPGARVATAPAAGAGSAGPVRLVLDDRAVLAAAAGAGTAAHTETGVRVRAGEVVARADGRGAGYAVATAPARTGPAA